MTNTENKQFSKSSDSCGYCCLKVSTSSFLLAAVFRDKLCQHSPGNFAALSANPLRVAARPHRCIQLYKDQLTSPCLFTNWGICHKCLLNCLLLEIFSFLFHFSFRGQRALLKDVLRKWIEITHEKKRRNIRMFIKQICADVTYSSFVQPIRSLYNIYRLLQ